MINQKGQYLSNRIRGIFFDMDGTLYDQSKLRSRMAIEILKVVIRNPRKIREIKIIFKFRKIREYLANCEANNPEYLSYELTAKQCNYSPELVREVVRHWIIEKPLTHLRECMVEFVPFMISTVRRSGKFVAVVSDYPSEEKIKAMGLTVDLAVCTTDSSSGKLKPNPAGFLTAAQRLVLTPTECLCVGDRLNRDGVAASRAGMYYLIFKDGLKESPCRSIVQFVQGQAELPLVRCDRLSTMCEVELKK